LELVIQASEALTIARRSALANVHPVFPAIHTWSLVDDCPTFSHTEISITGKYFGAHDSTVGIKLAASSFRTNRWVSDSSVLGKPQFTVELLSRGIFVSVGNAIGKVPFGYVCSNLGENEPRVSLSSHFISDRDVTMKILFTPFSGIQEKGSIVLTLTGGAFVFPPAADAFPLAVLDCPEKTVA
jgi:hypothetical protein